MASARRRPPALKDIARTVSIVYILHLCLRLRLPSLFSGSLKLRAWLRTLRSIRPPFPSIALFPAIVPYLHQSLSNYVPESSKPFVLAPVLFLLPQKIRVQAATWATCWAVAAAVKREWKNDDPATAARRERWRDAFTIVLAGAGNAWLLWATLFEGGAGADGFSDLLYRCAPFYGPPLPKGSPTTATYASSREMYAAISSIALERFPACPPPSGVSVPEAFRTITAYHPVAEGHTRLLCALLHPSEPSCSKNALLSWVDSWGRFFKFLVGYMAASEVMKRGLKLMSEPLTALIHTLKSTVLGATFLAGSCTTSWAFICLLQRLLPNDKLVHSRWILNASLSSLWMLVLPRKRREDIAFYTARVAAYSIWKAGERRRLWKGVRNGEVLLFATSWAALAMFKLEDGGVGGICGRLMTLVDGIPEGKKQ